MNIPTLIIRSRRRIPEVVVPLIRGLDFRKLPGCDSPQ